VRADDTVPIYFLAIDAALDLLAEAHALLVDGLKVVLSSVLDFGGTDAVVAGLRELGMALVLRAGLLTVVEIRVLLNDVLHIDLRDVPVGPMPPLVHDLSHCQLAFVFICAHGRIL